MHLVNKNGNKSRVIGVVMLKWCIINFS